MNRWFDGMGYYESLISVLLHNRFLTTLILRSWAGFYCIHFLFGRVRRESFRSLMISQLVRDRFLR